MKIYLRILALMIVLLSVTAVSAAPVQQATNLLENPSLERPFPNGIAENWRNWFRNDPPETKDPDCLNGYHFRPKWNDESGNTDLIHEGFSSQYVGNNWDTWQAGVYQTVAVTPGQAYRFTFFARVHATNEEGSAASEGSLEANVRAGIDPNGSENWGDTDVVWGFAGSPHDTWQQFSVEATATGNQLTVFTAADWGVEGVNQCRLFLDAWFDSAQLIEILPPATETATSLPTLPPPPPATNTPFPAATANIQPTATTPTATAVPTETPIPGATICVNAFADANANGLRDESESYIAGITFRVGDIDELIGQAVSVGTSEAVCFKGVPTGSYQVSQIVPANLQMTTAPNATIEVEEGKTYGVEFGSRIPPVGISNNDTSSPDTIASNATLPTAVPGAAPSGGVNWLVAGGIFVAVIAILGVGAFILLVLRRGPG